MPVISPMIKLIEFNPIGTFTLGDKIIHWHEAPGGISLSRNHLNPKNSRRTQDGTLITQTIRYNKKAMNLTFSFFDITTKTYFESLYESGLRTTLKVWAENPSTFVEETEFDGTVDILSFEDDIDQGQNIRTINMTLAEV